MVGELGKCRSVCSAHEDVGVAVRGVAIRKMTIADEKNPPAIGRYGGRGVGMCGVGYDAVFLSCVIVDLPYLATPFRVDARTDKGSLVLQRVGIDARCIARHIVVGNIVCPNACAVGLKTGEEYLLSWTTSRWANSQRCL